MAVHDRADVFDRRGVEVGRAVIRNREVPTGTEGGRKQPTRTPSSRQRAATSAARCGSPMMSDTTAADGFGAPQTVAIAAALARTRCASEGSRARMSSAAAAAPTAAGLRPVSKMNGRAVSLRWARRAVDPRTAPPCAPSDFDITVVITRSGAPTTPLGDHSAPTRSAHAERMGLVDQQGRPMCPGDRVEVGDRCDLAVDAVHRIGHDQRASPPTCGQSRRNTGDVAAIDDDDPGPRQPASVDQRGVGPGVADDEVAAPDKCGDGAEVGEVSRREAESGTEAGEVGQVRFKGRVALRGARHQSRPGRSGAEVGEGTGSPGDDAGSADRPR